MRLTKPLTYELMRQNAAKGGCVVCLLLKSYQTTLLEGLHAAELKQLCNYHGWSIAAAVDAKTAAEAFLRMLKHDTALAPASGCEFCTLVRQEEQTRLAELGRVLAERDVLEWVQTHDALCVPHATRVGSRVSSGLHSEILIASAHGRERMKIGLTSLLREFLRDSHSGAGVLGRAAEFLFGYRGMQRTW